MTQIIAGIDEVGRGSLAGPVVAAAVILEPGFQSSEITDSKKLSHKRRIAILSKILDNSTWCVGISTVNEIEELNIQEATFLAMHRAINGLKTRPDKLLIDGNVFKPYQDIEHICIVKGDLKEQSIGAASILAKVWRDHHMANLPQSNMYDWAKNKGYGTKKHVRLIEMYGECKSHRPSFLRTAFQNRKNK